MIAMPPLQVRQPLLVDCHAHVYTTDMPLSATAWHHPHEDATIERYISTLEAHGVTHAVMAAASLYDDYNEYMISAVRGNPRLRTTAIVRPDIDPYVMRQMKADGVVGVRFQWRKVDGIPDLKSAAYRLESLDVAAACAKRLLWGSDWPFAAFESKVSYRDTLNAFERCVPDPVVRRIIGGETPFGLYFS